MPQLNTDPQRYRCWQKMTNRDSTFSNDWNATEERESSRSDSHHSIMNVKSSKGRENNIEENHRLKEGRRCVKLLRPSLHHSLHLVWPSAMLSYCTERNPVRVTPCFESTTANARTRSANPLMHDAATNLERKRQRYAMRPSWRCSKLCQACSIQPRESR